MKVATVWTAEGSPSTATNGEAARGDHRRVGHDGACCGRPRSACQLVADRDGDVVRVGARVVGRALLGVGVVAADREDVRCGRGRRWSRRSWPSRRPSRWWRCKSAGRIRVRFGAARVGERRDRLARERLALDRTDGHSAGVYGRIGNDGCGRH